MHEIEINYQESVGKERKKVKCYSHYPMISPPVYVPAVSYDKQLEEFLSIIGI